VEEEIMERDMERERERQMEAMRAGRAPVDARGVRWQREREREEGRDGGMGRDRRSAFAAYAGPMAGAFYGNSQGARGW
jgi:hypothetical protein